MIKNSLANWTRFNIDAPLKNHFKFPTLIRFRESTTKGHSQQIRLKSYFHIFVSWFTLYLSALFDGIKDRKFINIIRISSICIGLIWIHVSCACHDATVSFLFVFICSITIWLVILLLAFALPRPNGPRRKHANARTTKHTSCARPKQLAEFTPQHIVKMVIHFVRTIKMISENLNGFSSNHRRCQLTIRVNTFVYISMYSNGKESDQVCTMK